MSNHCDLCGSELKFVHLRVFICLILSLSPGCLSQSSFTGLEKDSQLLLQFKNGMHQASILGSWLRENHPCIDFEGVMCDKAMRVVSVDLSFVPLRSELRFVADTLFQLEFLQMLSLSSTNLTGALSSVSAPRCSDTLVEVDLSSNGLSGSVSDISAFAACSAIKSLNLSRNMLSSFSGDTGQGAFAGLGFLQSLDLSFNYVSGHVLRSMLYPGCGGLKYLSMKKNGISGDVSFSGCPDLEFLDMSSNNFSDGMPSFGDCSALRHLDLSDNSFSGEISNRLTNCSRLEFLNLSGNAFSGHVPLIFTQTLKFLHLSGNRFDAGMPESLPFLCAGLVELDVSLNRFSGVIPDAFRACSYLVELNLASNEFSGGLPMGALVKMTNLKKLILSYNSIAGDLPESLSELTNLEVLDASSNNFSGFIPPGLCWNSTNALRELYLQNNFFSGGIPAGLSNCSKLRSLDLSFNFISGSVPGTLGELSELRDLMIWMNRLHGDIPPEIGNLQLLENLILDFNEMTGEIPISLENCLKLNWISLSNNRLTGRIPSWIGNLRSLAILQLGNNSFTGQIPPEIGNCSNLIWLDLNTNQLNGTIPPDLFKQSGKIAVGLITGKRFAYIKNDGSSKACHGAGNLVEFAGIRLEQLTRVSTKSPCNFTRVYGGITQATFSLNGSMIFADLSFNRLTGKIPKEIGSMFYVQVLNLGHNNLAGEIPAELGNLARVNILDLSHNQLEGSIPVTMTKLSMLAELDLSNNRLSGVIPESSQFESFPDSRYMNNSGLCGYPLTTCSMSSGQNTAGENHRKSRSRASLAGSITMAILFSLFCVAGVIVVVVEIRKRKHKRTSSGTDVFVDPRSQSVTLNGNWKFTAGIEALSTNLAAFDKPLRKLTFGDLMEATNGFHHDSLVGSGGFGDVYRAQLSDGAVVAIKKLIHVSGQGEREFTAEMETIGKIKHRNLVPLLGYCKVGEERLLVYEYMKHGSLEDVLHDRKNRGVKLNWSSRRKIAIGAARGLAFLHHNCVPHIIHRDMKSSNVLLDENLEARVSDFGMARLMSAVDTHLSVSTLAGTPGYVPPEYYQSFRCSTRGDVYSYGVVLLELLTGRSPTDSADFGDSNLVGWVKQHAKLKISDVFDHALVKEDSVLELELLQHLKVACACLDDRPWRRPTIIQVLAMFKEIHSGGGGEVDSASTVAAGDGGLDSGVASAVMTVTESHESKTS